MEGSKHMIVYPSYMATLQAEWDGVIRMRERIRHLVIFTFALDAKKSPAFGDVLYNLPLVIAFGVLKQVLQQARDQERSRDSQQPLDALMESAKTSLPWIDWRCLRAAVKRQTEVSLEGKLFGDVQCLQDIAAIEAQLVAWGVIAVAESYIPARTMSFQNRF
jgi:hypothetical protein